MHPTNFRKYLGTARHKDYSVHVMDFLVTLWCWALGSWAIGRQFKAASFIFFVSGVQPMAAVTFMALRPRHLVAARVHLRLDGQRHSGVGADLIHAAIHLRS